MFPAHPAILSVPAPQKCFRLVMAYDGTDFSGWQVQPGLRTVQGMLADAIRRVTGEVVLPQGSGRTDAGVHAEGQVVSLQLQAEIPPDRLRTALNRRLPPAIRVVDAQRAPGHFHARADVLSKTYEYRIFLRHEPGSDKEGVCLPAMARFAWDCRWPLLVHPMQEAALQLVGTQDFSSFAATDPDRTRRLNGPDPSENNVRTVFQSTWELCGDLLRYQVTGSGFLHHMVRNMVGTCVAIGAGRMPPGAIPGILQARDRRRAGETAPAQGLHLLRVIYREDPDTVPEPESR